MSRTSFIVNLHSIVCLNVKELLARSRRHIWSLSDSNEIRTHNHSARKQTLNHLAKLALFWLNGWVLVYELTGCGFESRCWIALFCKRNETVYFDTFGVEYVTKEIEKSIEHKNIKTNIFRIQSNDSIICGYFCIGFIGFMIVAKTLIDFTSLFSHYDLKKMRIKFWVIFKMNKVSGIEKIGKAI